MSHDSHLSQPGYPLGLRLELQTAITGPRPSSPESHGPDAAYNILAASRL